MQTLLTLAEEIEFHERFDKKGGAITRLIMSILAELT